MALRAEVVDEALGLGRFSWAGEAREGKGTGELACEGEAGVAGVGWLLHWLAAPFIVLEGSQLDRC